MNEIYILPMGEIDMKMLQRVINRASDTLAFSIRLLSPDERPDYAFDAPRRQFHSTKILKHMLNNPLEGSLKTIGIVDVDLFIPILTFVFGEAQLGGKVAVVSMARLKQEFYGLQKNEPLLEERLFKELLHEIGHTFGLTHCHSIRCVMYLANSIRDVDVKGSIFCENCKEILRKNL